MGKSLQDQLLNAGVASATQVKKVKADKRKQKKQQQKNNIVTVDENKLSVQKAKQEKAEKDRLLNQQKTQQAEQKAIAAQVRQLIEQNKVLQGDEEIPYHFAVGSKVKTIYVNSEIKKQLGSGRLAIVQCDKGYQVIALAVAEKIMQRDASIIFKQSDTKQEPAADDPYADYEIPDDLMW